MEVTEGHGEKRERVESIIANVLNEDVARKKAKIDDRTGKPRRVTINEEINIEHTIETEDQGPIKEHLINDAYAKRQQAKAGHDGSVLRRFEETGGPSEQKSDIRELDGNILEAFNMDGEREEGYIDESGSFVRRRNRDEEELAQDAWLSNLEVVSEDVLDRIAAREQEATDSKPVSENEVAHAKVALAAVMQPRETVMQALTRISAKPVAQKVKPRDRVGKRPMTPADVKQKADIDSFLESVTTVQATEADIYDQRKEELEYAVKVASALAGPSSATTSTGAAGDDDIFGDSDDEAPPEQKPVTVEPSPSIPQVQSEGDAVPTPSQQVPASTPSSATDYSQWPVSELKRVLKAENVDTSGCTEKSELVKKMTEVDDKGKEAEVPPAADIPTGFVFDAESGYYLNSALNLYYDAQSKYYYKNGMWLTIDSETGRMVRVEAV